MRPRVTMGLPALFALIVLGAILWGRQGTNVATVDGSGTAPALTHSLPDPGLIASTAAPSSGTR